MARVLIFLLVSFVVFAEQITQIINYKETEKGGKIIYTGNVIYNKTGLSADGIRCNLVDCADRAKERWKVFDEFITGSDGRFQLVGPKHGLSILLQPKKFRKLTYDFGTELDKPTPLIEQIAKDIRKIFKIENYGYYQLLKREDAYIEICGNESFLCVKRNFDEPPFFDGDILNGEPYDCFEVSYAIAQYIRSRYSKKTIDAFPFAWSTNIGKEHLGPELNHVLTKVAIEDGGKIYKVIFDGTPLNKVLNPKVGVQGIIVPSAALPFDYERFKALAQKISFAGIGPMKFETKQRGEGFYVLAGITATEKVLHYNLEIFDVSPGTEKQEFKTNDLIFCQFFIPRAKLSYFQSRLWKVKPGEILKNFSSDIKVSGSVKMKKVLLRNQDILYYLVAKTRL